MSFELPVTAVIINFKTADLMRRAISSFRMYYPTTRLLLIDNGSHDESGSMLSEFRQRLPEYTELIMNDHNVYHGPAMHQALRHLHTPFGFFLDFDCEGI